MSLIKRFLHGFKYGRCAGEKPTVKQEGAQAIAIRHLIAHGKITGRDILKHTNDFSKLVYRLRKMGLLYPVGHPTGEYWMPNKSGHGQHKVYRHTGKLPASWLKKGGM